MGLSIQRTFRPAGLSGRGSRCKPHTGGGGAGRVRTGWGEQCSGGTPPRLGQCCWEGWRAGGRRTAGRSQRAAPRNQTHQRPRRGSAWEARMWPPRSVLSVLTAALCPPSCHSPGLVSGWLGTSHVECPRRAKERRWRIPRTRRVSEGSRSERPGAVHSSHMTFWRPGHAGAAGGRGWRPLCLLCCPGPHTERQVTRSAHKACSGPRRTRAARALLLPGLLCAARSPRS